MLNKMMRFVIPGLLLLLAQSAQALEVENAWIREAPPSAQMMGGFMTLKNDSDKPMVLTGAHSKAFKMIMLHRTVEKDGMARMIHQDKVVIPAHGTLEFKPGSYHIMMPSPAKRLVAGDKVTITLEFEGGKHVDVVYTVRKGKMMMHNMDGMNTGHQHGM
jgi:copper(I)-binding protein